MAQSKYSRVLLKLSGEALMGQQSFGIEAEMLNYIAMEIQQLNAAGVQVGLVIGGGNIFRGVGLAAAGMDRVAGDHMGMLATVINSIAMQNALENLGMEVRVMSALSIAQVCEDYSKRNAIQHLQKGRIVIFSAGTGNPFFTTDSAASLRGVEIEAEVVIKATKVDGVYDSDPQQNAQAKLFKQLTYDQVIEQKLNVMDATAIVLCRDQKMPIRVYNMAKPGALADIVINGQDEGTLVI